MRCISPLLLLAVAARLSPAQSPSTTLTPSRLTMGETKYNVFMIFQGDTTLNGSLTDRLTLDGAQIRRFYSGSDAMTGPTADTFVVSSKDLRPICVRTHDLAGAVHFDFKGDSITGWRQQGINAPSEQIRASVKSLFYDSWSFDLLIRASDLRDNFEFAFPIMKDDPPNIQIMSGKVSGSASINGADCWIVPAKFGNLPVTFWIDKKSRALRKQFVEIAPGMGVMLVATGA